MGFVVASALAAPPLLLPRGVMRSDGRFDGSAQLWDITGPDSAEAFMRYLLGSNRKRQSVALLRKLSQILLEECCKGLATDHHVVLRVGTGRRDGRVDRDYLGMAMQVREHWKDRHRAFTAQDKPPEFDAGRASGKRHAKGIPAVAVSCDVDGAAVEKNSAGSIERGARGPRFP
jgi:hypothetical protein